MEKFYSKQAFEEVFKEILKALSCKENLSPEFGVVTARIKNLVNYTVPHLTKMRGYLVPVLIEKLSDKTRANSEQEHLSCVLGWCFQILQAILTSIDDICDDDNSRFGKPTWWQLENKKRIVVSDMILLKHEMLQLLYKYFGPTTLYVKMVTYFNEITSEFLLGQSQGNLLTSKRDSDMIRFNIKEWEICARYTCKKYMFQGPIGTALIFLSDKIPNCTSLMSSKLLDDVFEQITFYWKTLDDFYDSYCNDPKNPLTHRDIQKGSCNWMIIKAKEIASPEQWMELKSCYGKKDPKLVKKVINIFTQLGVPDLCKERAELLLANAEKNIQQMMYLEPNVAQVVGFFLKHFSKLKE